MQITSAEELRLIFQENAKLRCEIKEIQADYENRLKADMVAMLTEIQLEFEELENPFGTRISGCSQDGWKHGVKNCDFVIQQRINALKGKQKGKNEVEGRN